MDLKLFIKFNKHNLLHQRQPNEGWVQISFLKNISTLTDIKVLKVKVVAYNYTWTHDFTGHPKCDESIFMNILGGNIL